MLALYWTIILGTKNLTTAFKLLDRVHVKLAVPMEEIWIREWNAPSLQYQSCFRTPLSNFVDNPQLTALVLVQAFHLSSTWTLEFLPGGDVPRTELLHVWTPDHYRKFTMEGIVNAALVVRAIESAQADMEFAREEQPGPDNEGVRQYVTRRGLPVRVITGRPTNLWS